MGISCRSLFYTILVIFAFFFGTVWKRFSMHLLLASSPLDLPALFTVLFTLHKIMVLVFYTSGKFTYITPILYIFYWLPVKPFFHFIIVVITYKIPYFPPPSYPLSIIMLQKLCLLLLSSFYDLIVPRPFFSRVGNRTF